MKREWFARGIIIGLLSLATLAVGMGWRWHQRSIVLRARMPEAGGWAPADIQASVGQPLYLRLTSEDVTHSFAIGQMEFPAVDVHPGEVTEVRVTFDRPGKYTFYCTRWCGANHWRMRGTIEVTGDGATSDRIEQAQSPLYVRLGLDIDAPHPAGVIPQVKPSSWESQDLLGQLPPSYLEQAYYRTRSPVEVWQELREEPSFQELEDGQIWSLVAALWQKNTSAAALETGRELFAQNCAACHGETGGGNGVFADQVSIPDGAPEAGAMGHDPKVPTDFSDPEVMLGASPALLQGKILRGGMGTGMPYWGPIFTEDQIWALVDYLWTFQLDYNLEVNP